MNKLIPQIVKMGAITVKNNTGVLIYVSVTATGSDFSQGGNEDWFTVQPNGGSEVWNYRTQRQVVRFIKSDSPGSSVESVLGVPGKTVNIN